MLKERSSLAKFTFIAIDTILMVIAFWLAYHVYPYTEVGGLKEFDRYAWILIFIIPVLLFSLNKYRLYGDIRALSTFQIISNSIFSFLIGFFALGAILYFTKSGYYSRMLCLLFFFFALFLIVCEKLIIAYFKRILISKGFYSTHVLIIGGGPKLEKITRAVKEQKGRGIHIIDTVNISNCELDSLDEEMRNQVIDEVYISFSRDTQHKTDFEDLLLLFEKYGKTVRFVINLDEAVSYSKIDFSHTGNIPTLVFHTKTLDADQLFIKRSIDIVGSLIGLLFTGLLFPFITIAIKLESRGPVLFAHKRVGMNGRLFTAYKFRSMYENANEQKKELMERNERSGPIFKIKNDPRITTAGKLLRKASIDECPQFWNVLKGEMSLVGTRPPSCDEVECYEGWHYRRVSIKPGITGLWQVNGRGVVRDFNEVVKLDLEYIDNWSLWTDLKIIAKTIWVVLQCSGE